MKALQGRQAVVRVDEMELGLRKDQKRPAREPAEHHNMTADRDMGDGMAVEQHAVGWQLQWQGELQLEHSVEEDESRGAGRSEDTCDMVLASGLQVCDPEEIESDLLEVVGNLDRAGEDIEGKLETVAAGEHQGSHHVQGQEWLVKRLWQWQEEAEGLLAGKVQVPKGIAGKKETDTDTVETAALEGTEPEQRQGFHQQIVQVHETEETADTVACLEIRGAEMKVLGFQD